jgi:5-deoxy-D-glucuronate isomerase
MVLIRKGANPDPTDRRVFLQMGQRSNVFDEHGPWDMAIQRSIRAVVTSSPLHIHTSATPGAQTLKSIHQSAHATSGV